MIEWCWFMEEKLIRLTLNCNQRCIFCNTYGNKDIVYSPKMFCNYLIKYKGKTIKLLFTGGEPTIIKYLPFYIQTAKRYLSHNSIIGIQSNILKFADYEYTKKIVEAGLNYIFISFHHYNSDIFDTITGRKNAFLVFKKAMTNIVKFNLDIDINIVVNKLNYKDLLYIVKYIHDNFKFNIISLSVVQPNGLADNNYNIVPKYELIRPYLIKTYDFCIKNNITFINPNCGIPLCFVKGYEKYSYDYLVYKKGLIKDSVSKIKTSKCFNCKMKNMCGGLWENYIKMYGDSGLDPY